MCAFFVETSPLPSRRIASTSHRLLLFRVGTPKARPPKL
jgi:hypothetical protein